MLPFIAETKALHMFQVFECIYYKDYTCKDLYFLSRSRIYVHHSWECVPDEKKILPPIIFNKLG